MDNKFFLIRLLREINSSTNSTTASSISFAEFPDAVTERGKKHLENLILAKQQGYESYLIFLIQIERCKSFNIASDIDPGYFKVLKEALNKKVNVLCYNCKFSNKGIDINNKIDFFLDDR